MNQVLSAQQQLDRWLYLNPHARTIPPHIQQCIDILERHRKAQECTPGTGNRYELARLQDELELEAIERAGRRNAEHELADYIRGIADGMNCESFEDIELRQELVSLSNRLGSCRMSGTVGLIEGRPVMAWDYKCGLVRLCPDESREETQRLTDFYLPAMLDWCRESPLHRVYYAVFTVHNFRPGHLKTGKQYLFEKFKAWMNARYQYCPAIQRHGSYIQTQQMTAKVWPQIKGAFVVQEDPLSATGDWNVHLNVFLFVKGEFSYKAVRETWGANIHITELGRDEQSLRSALLEAIKYSAQTVPEKSDGKAAAGDTAAPAMTEWPPERWIEWWKANQGFRRTRAYGCLYALHAKRWDAMDMMGRTEVLRIAGAPMELCKLTWKEIGQDMKKKDRERLKVALRKAMTHGERLDMNKVEWIGTVQFTADGRYRVDLIPGDNFSASRRLGGNFSGPSGGSGPPDYGGPPAGGGFSG